MLLLIGFYALLRPCELLALRVQDFLAQHETGFPAAYFIKLTLVKSRTVRLDIPFVVSFLQRNFQVMNLSLHFPFPPAPEDAAESRRRQ